MGTDVVSVPKFTVRGLRMKSYDYEAVTYDCDIYCTGCLPDGVSDESEGVFPIFADSEWDYIPVCCECGYEHDYVSIIGD